MAREKPQISSMSALEILLRHLELVLCSNDEKLLRELCHIRT